MLQSLGSQLEFESVRPQVDPPNDVSEGRVWMVLMNRPARQKRSLLSKVGVTARER